MGEEIGRLVGVGLLSPEGFAVGPPPSHNGPVDGAARAAAAQQAGAESARDDAKVRALTGEVLPPEAPPVDPAAELRAGVSAFWTVVGKVVERRYGKDWALEPGEVDLLTTGCLPLAGQMMEFLGAPPPLIAAVGVVGLVYGGKVFALAQAEEKPNPPTEEPKGQP